MKNLEKAHEDWRQKMQQIIVDGVVKTRLEYAKEVHAYQQFCKESESKKGGSRFTENMLTWFGENKDSCSQLATIGSDYDRLMTRIDRLPNAQSSLFFISKMDDDTFTKAIANNVIKQGATTVSIKSYVNDLEQLEYQREHEKTKEIAEEKHQKARKEEDAIPSEELMEDDDFELVGIDEDGNEIWELKGSGVSEVPGASNSKEGKKESFDRDGTINSIMQFVMSISNKLNDDDLVRFEEWVRDYE